MVGGVLTCIWRGAISTVYGRGSAEDGDFVLRLNCSLSPTSLQRAVCRTKQGLLEQRFSYLAPQEAHVNMNRLTLSNVNMTD